MTLAKKKKKSPKTKLTPEKKEQKAHITEIRRIHTQSGFERLAGVNKDIEYHGFPGEFDDIFVYKHIILIGEYTTLKSSSEIGKHIKKKGYLYREILKDTSKFVAFLKQTFPDFLNKVSGDYHNDDFIVKIFYASKNSIDETHKQQIDFITYLDYPILKYFLNVVGAVKNSAINEILNFYGFKYEEILGTPQGGKSSAYHGSVLPEKHSNFPTGFKVVSFYIKPLDLLQRAYVLRKHGWEDSQILYQRMISKGKVEAIRKFLKENKRVFINNIIVTLPSKTQLLDNKGKTIDVRALKNTEPACVQIPDEYNSIGIIDGQHRVFSYYEGAPHEEIIKDLRSRQNLLVTGIIYPDDISPLERVKFEANQFLEINSKQTNAKSDLKQAIGLIINPFAPASVGKRIIDKINESGPLKGQFEVYFFDTHKIKTTSIVSYGLVPIVKLSGDDSFYSVWDHLEKEKLKEGNNKDILDDYISFCTKEINEFLLAVKLSISSEKWTPDKKIKGRVLTTTHINGFIICLRQLIENNKLSDTDDYKKKLKNLDAFDFKQYRSSQYGRMGRDMYEKYFC